MKKSLLLLVTIIVFFCSKSFAQSLGSTTEEEYNYLTKGYKVQIESGLDPKKGYVLEDIKFVTHGNYTFDFKALVRSSKKEVAGILVITKSKILGRTYYTCIPINNTELDKNYWADLRYWDRDLIGTYCFYSSGLFANIFSEKFNNKIVKK